MALSQTDVLAGLKEIVEEVAGIPAASIPLAMDVLLEKHPEMHGKLALLIGYGAGLVYAGQVVQLPPAP